MAALEPGLPRPAQPREVQIQAWVTPPAYTGVAPVFLKPDHPAVAVPMGARLTVNLTGGASVPDLVLDGVANPVHRARPEQFSDRADAGQGNARRR